MNRSWSCVPKNEIPKETIHFVGCTGVSRYREGTESRQHNNLLCVRVQEHFLNLGGTADSKNIRPKLQTACGLGLSFLPEIEQAEPLINPQKGGNYKNET